MGKKYSINSAGRIVAERDIYSLGGFIPKGRLGGAIKDETQLSQDGECWLAGGSIATRPDIVIKDNAYIGDFYEGTNPVHTDIITEFSGNTKIPGYLSVRCFAADTKNNTFIKDSFIGVTMDVLCGPATNPKAHPFEQGQYNKDAPKGTLFTSSSMKLDAANCVRNTATIRIGKDTYVYTPSGYNARIFWAYYDTSNQLAFSGETTPISSAITKLSHPVYNVCMIMFAKSPTLTPADLEAAGAKILGHVSGSVLMDFRPESVSGGYVMDNSSLIMNTDNFGLATTQLRFLAGGLFSTNMYTLTNRQDYKPYGTFRNVERLEYNQYFADIHRGNVNRDRYITALDSPLVRIGDGFVSGDLVNAGGLTLRRCIVPKGIFQNDVINGNTYEDIDFSYTNEFMGNTVGNRVFIASRKQGLYGLYAGSGLTLGFASYPDNTKDAASVTEKHNYVPLDGNLIESGTYAGDVGRPYEANKIPATNRVRFIRPLPTFGANIPSLPAGYAIRAVHYLDEAFITRKAVENPTTIEYEFPFFVMSFQKTDPEASLPVSEFIALGRTILISDYHKVPEITGSAYLGKGVTIRGDVQLHGDPYVNRILDVNEWEKGGISTPDNKDWDAAKTEPGAYADAVRRRLKEVIQVEPGAKITCNSGYWVNCYFYDAEGKFISSPGWGQIANTVPDNAAFTGVILKKAVNVNDPESLIEDSDIPLAGVKYLRAFKKRRYITNELDQKSPEDILLADYYWEQGAFYTDTGRVGRPYNDIKYTQSDRLRLSKPLPAGNATLTVANYWEYAMAKFDAGTRLLESSSEGYSMVSMTLRKAPPVTVNPSDAKDARLVITCIPQPRIIVPYGSNTLNINGVKIRMYDNAVLSRNFNQEGSITLQGDAVMGYDFDSGACLCSNGHSDAIIKLP
ncbi:hypothetical protein I6E77_12490 [Bacteroides thetaiotaomicron]|jgi:hypothetical protein|uniref:hypothetical protein n=1 Tax=Bacteroides thetaiotaomicron TaxID=818 RepID=UPI001F45FB4F|nr:hypothetical protein [Bacteroides thetaiotaomicron]MCF2734091.1 hypothetical protein [Bacteroides thetaiotaomicron]